MIDIEHFKDINGMSGHPVGGLVHIGLNRTRGSDVDSGGTP